MARESGPQRRERQRKQREAQREKEAEAPEQSAGTIGVASFGGVNSEAVSLAYNLNNSRGRTDLSGLEGSSAGVLSYPRSHVISSTSDYVSFEFFKYKPPFAKGEGENTSGQAASYNASSDFGSGDNILGEVTGSCIMYMPEDIQAEYGANWGAAGFGALSRTLLRGSTGNIDGETILKDLLGSAEKGIVDAIVGGANKALGQGVTTNQIFGGRSGKVVNPNVEMMYEAPEMRGFTLSFKMTPSTEEEAKEIKLICNLFKRSMLPRFDGAFVKVPDVVRVTFMTGPSPNVYIPQFKPCAITNVSINSTAEGAWAAYKSGVPVSTELSIQFKELKMLFSEDIQDNTATY